MVKSMFKKFSEWLFEQDALPIFVLICLTFALTALIQQKYVLVDAVYYNSFGEQLADDRIEKMISMRDEWAWLSYLLIPVLVVLQVFLITICLNIGTILFNYRIGFVKLFRLVMKVQLLPTVVQLIATLVAWQFLNIQTFDDLAKSNFYAISALFNLSDIPKWLYYPLHTINILEVAFCLVLAFGIRYVLSLDYAKSLRFVGLTYGLGLFFWVTFMVFLQLNLS